MAERDSITGQFARKDLTLGPIINGISLIRCIGKIKTNIAWECTCHCGKIFTALASNLRSGNTKSCGCQRYAKNPNHRHGMSRDRIHRLWSNMIARCHSPTSKAYKNYGARGIAVCDRWHVFENFFEDFGRLRVGNQSIERVDNNDGYRPGNCEWSTPREQSRNKRSNLRITIKGETRLLCDWAEFSGLDSSLIRARKFRLGWPDDELLTSPWGRKKI